MLPVVRKMEKKLAADDTLNKEYLPVLGLEAAATAATTMLLGADNPAVLEGRVSVDNYFVNTAYEMIMWYDTVFLK